MRTAMARGVLWSLLAAGFVVSAYGGTDNAVYSNLSFNLSNPGARSLALGGAFTGLADDATAAYANPAGLTQIFKPQMSIEGRYSSNETQYARGGTYLSPPPTGNQFPQPFNGIVTGTTTDSSFRPSFISIMLPHGRWGIGLFRHELSNVSFQATTNQVTSFDGTLPPLTETLSLRIVDWGVAGAFNLTDNVTVGASLSYFQNSLNSSTLQRSVTNSLAVDRGSKSAIGANLGILIKSGKASFGAVYHRSPAFPFSSTQTTLGASRTINVDFKTPDAYGVGMVYRFSDTFYSSTDVQKVKYSDLTDPSRFNTVNVFPDAAAAYHADDSLQYRVGFEKAFIRQTNPSVFALRFGAWYDPAHATNYSGNFSVRAASFLPGKNLTHLTGGLGFVFGEFQADVGADVSSRTKIMSISFVKSFKPFSR